MKKFLPYLLTTLLTAPCVCLVFCGTFLLTGLNGPFPTLPTAGFTLLCVSASVWIWRRAGRTPAAGAGRALLQRGASVCLSGFGIFLSFCNWLNFWMPTVQTIPLKDGYCLTVYQDLDVGGEELNYSLQSPRGSSQKSFFAQVSGEGHPVPHFTLHATADQRVAWVTADTKLNWVVFLLDRSKGQFWPQWGRGQLQWPNDKNYLDRINADGGHRSFYQGFWRLDQPSPWD